MNVAHRGLMAASIVHSYGCPHTSPHSHNSRCSTLTERSPSPPLLLLPFFPSSPPPPHHRAPVLPPPPTPLISSFPIVCWLQMKGSCGWHHLDASRCTAEPFAHGVRVEGWGWGWGWAVKGSGKEGEGWGHEVGGEGGGKEHKCTAERLEVYLLPPP